ncbi:MAG TPA: rRNA maturation RNase YbeY [Acidobacteriaceae bacterium]|jgi:probable rRNA maturation factor|nr:rRNA maturation RNase YbeY [Acidobacteriaceae bacterium]
MTPIEILTEPRIQAKFGRALERGALAVFVETAAAAVRVRGGISILLTGDREIRRLNREFRRKDKATDVLSFPAPAGSANGEMAGDLAISAETAARQAEGQGHGLAVELRILALHGLLHLAGFDHEADAGEMARREAALRRRFGLAAGLIERAEAGRAGQVSRRTPARTSRVGKAGVRPGEPKRGRRR